MGFFSSSNKNAYSVSLDRVATGPRAGFFDSWASAYDAQMRASSTQGIEFFMHELDWKQTRAMRDAGVETPPRLNALDQDPSDYAELSPLAHRILPYSSGQYREIARYYGKTGDSLKRQQKAAYLEDAPGYGADIMAAYRSELQQRLRAYDERITAIRKDYPDLELFTSQEMYEQVRRSAAESELREQRNRRGVAGFVGGFLGGTVASVDPRTDPLNFATLPVGGVGKSVGARIVSQVAAQGAVESVNQVTGVQESRKLLGLSHGFSDGAQRVAGTALGAGVLQGGGELVAFGAKRFFRNTPDDPAPSIDILETPRERVQSPRRRSSGKETRTPDQLTEDVQTQRLEENPDEYINIIADSAPVSDVRGGRARSVDDLADTFRQLNDWTGPEPTLVKPRAAVDSIIDEASLRQTAQQVDPPAFRQYDRLLERRDMYQRQIKESLETSDPQLQSELEEIEIRMNELNARLRTSQDAKNKERIQKQIEKTHIEREELLDKSSQSEAPETTGARRQLVNVENKMQRLVPLLGRAYARARGQWSETIEDLNAVWQGFREGRSEPTMPRQDTPSNVESPASLTDRVPLLEDAHKVQSGATSADTAQRILAENAKVIDTALQAYRDQVKRLTETESGNLKVDGREYVFDLDKDTMFVPHEDGIGGREITLREYLSENKRLEDELEAVQTCSTR